VEHLQHFGLSLDPFQIEPDLRFYYDSPLHSDAQRRVERGLRQSKGLSILTGASGTGKSLLARRLFSRLEEEMFEAALMVMLPGAADTGSVLARFAKHLEIEDRSDDSARAIGQIYEQLAVVREDGRHSILILDDAHLLSPTALAEVGALLTLEYEDRRLVSILLVGSPALDADVANDPSLGQRVDIRVNLSPLDFDNASAYLANRLQVAGGVPGIIPADAVQTLFKYSGGRPRLINTLADNALFEAYLAGRQQIDVADVERAAGDLGIGVGPGSGHSTGASPPASAAGSPTQRPDLLVAVDTAEPNGGALVDAREPQPQESGAAPADDDEEVDLGALLDIVEPEPEAGANFAAEEMDIDSLLETVAPEPQASADPLAAAELDLEIELGTEAGESELGSPLGAQHPAEQTRLMLDDEPMEFEIEDSEALASEGSAALELGDPLGPDDGYGSPEGGRALELEADDVMPSPELESAGDATRLILPGEADELLMTAEAVDESDEVDAAFGKLLED